MPAWSDFVNAIVLIRSEPLGVISEAAIQPDPTELSPDELRICFPARIIMGASSEECVVLENAPMIGVVVDVAESLLRLKQGAPLVEVVDFYGEYKLVFRAQGESIECENEFAGAKCRVPTLAFRSAGKRWCNDVLAGIESNYPTIAGNAHYQRLKEQVARTWQDQELAT
jgi:hypothetical protein